MKEHLEDKLKNLKKAKKDNKVKFKWQDSALFWLQELSLPRKLHTDKEKKPLDVASMLMRQAKQNQTVFERRMSLVKEKGLAGEAAVKYYMGIIESENNPESNNFKS